MSAPRLTLYPPTYGWDPWGTATGDPRGVRVREDGSLERPIVVNEAGPVVVRDVNGEPAATFPLGLVGGGRYTITHVLLPRTRREHDLWGLQPELPPIFTHAQLSSERA